MSLRRFFLLLMITAQFAPVHDAPFAVESMMRFSGRSCPLRHTEGEHMTDEPANKARNTDEKPPTPEGGGSSVHDEMLGCGAAASERRRGAAGALGLLELYSCKRTSNEQWRSTEGGPRAPRGPRTSRWGGAARRPWAGS